MSISHIWNFIFPELDFTGVMEPYRPKIQALPFTGCIIFNNLHNFPSLCFLTYKIKKIISTSVVCWENYIGRLVKTPSTSLTCNMYPICLFLPFFSLSVRRKIETNRTLNHYMRHKDGNIQHNWALHPVKESLTRMKVSIRCYHSKEL